MPQKCKVEIFAVLQNKQLQQNNKQNIFQIAQNLIDKKINELLNKYLL